MSLRVLVIDDEPSVCANLCGFLEDEGMDVFSAYSGEEAMDVLEKGTEVDVVVTDMRLPGMDGNDTIRAIHAAYPTVQFAIHTGTSGYSVPGDLEAIGLGKEWVFKKPLEDMAILSSAIEQLVQRKGEHD